jgi:hypothetical protein
LTLFIAFNRARIVGSFSQANQHLHKTERDHIKETVLFGLLPGVVISIPLTVILAKVSDPESMKINNVSNFFAYLVFNLVMASLAFYIIFKTHRLNIDKSAKVMQKNVAAVTIVFCICHVPWTIFSGKLAFPSDIITIPTEVFNFFSVLNNSCNILIYVGVGKKFRTTLFKVLIECWQRGGRREGRRVEIRGIQGNHRCQGIPLTVTRVVPEGRDVAVVNKTRV